MSRLEHVVNIIHWQKHVKLTIFAIVLVDTINVQQNLIDDKDDLNETSHDWFTNLAMEMVDNTLDSRSSSREKWTWTEAAITPQSPSILTLGTTKDKKDGHLVQQQCTVCINKCTYICTLCKSDDHGCYDPHHVCDQRNKVRTFWTNHCTTVEGNVQGHGQGNNQ